MQSFSSTECSYGWQSLIKAPPAPTGDREEAESFLQECRANLLSKGDSSCSG